MLGFFRFQATAFLLPAFNLLAMSACPQLRIEFLHTLFHTFALGLGVARIRGARLQAYGQPGKKQT